MISLSLCMIVKNEEAVLETVQVTRVHEPDLEKHEQYKKQYQRYRSLYEDLKDSMSQSW